MTCLAGLPPGSRQPDGGFAVIPGEPGEFGEQS
jgi:hypothetical protein